MYSAHDNVVLSYEVNLQKRTISLHTEEQTQEHTKKIILFFPM